MPQHDAPSRPSRGARRGLLSEASSRRLAVIAIVTGILLGLLAAATGGYYAERSVLNPQGVQRGHSHVWVQDIGDGQSAPNADAAPLDFFKAVEDNGDGDFTLTITGLTAGNKKLCVNDADGSHRTAMTKAAKLAMPYDCVRLFVFQGRGGATTTTAAQTTTTVVQETTTTAAAPPDTTAAPPDTTAVPDTTAPAPQG